MSVTNRIPLSLFNCDLAGYRFIDIYEVTLSTDERASKHLGYYENPDLAQVQYKGQGWFGSDPYVRAELALVHESDPSTAFVLSGGTFRQVNVVPRSAFDAYQRAIAKLSPEELAVIKGRVY